MNRGWRICVASVACAAVVIVAVLVWPRAGEPEYKGRTLSSWIRGAADEKLPQADQAERIEAVRHIGTNALPYLLKWMEESEPPQVVMSRMDWVVIKVAPKRTAISWLKYRDRKYNWSRDVYWAFQMLDYYDRIRAVPELARLSQSTNREAAELAESALSRMELRPKTALIDYIRYTNQIAQGQVRPTGSIPVKSLPMPTGSGPFQVGRVLGLKSKGQVPAEVQATNSRPGKME